MSATDRTGVWKEKKTKRSGTWLLVANSSAAVLDGRWEDGVTNIFGTA